MTTGSVTRRRFAGALGIAAGASLAIPGSIAAADAPAAPAYPAGTLRLDSNENPYGPSPAAREAMGRARDLAARYPDLIEERLVQALAAKHGVTPENIILGCGSGEILRMADLAVLSAGRCVVAAEPTFEAVLLYARATRAHAIKVPLTADFRHDLPGMLAACPENAGLIYICNPNNPTGTIVGREALAAFLEKAPRSALVLVDEAYHHFVEDERYASAIPWVARHPNLLVARTFSKIHALAGMRLGYAVGSKETIDALGGHRLWSNTNAAVLQAALACVDDEAQVARQRRLLNDTRRRLAAELEKDGRRVIPSEANFLMVDLGRDIEPVIEAFRKRGILVGRRFPAMPEWLRVSIGTPEEMTAFLGALRAIVPAGSGRSAPDHT